MHAHTPSLVLLATLMAAGCATHRLPSKPDLRLAAIEARLLDAKAIECDFEIESSGVVSSKILGTVEIRRGEGADEVRLTAKGTFAGQPIDLSLTTADGEMFGGVDPEHHFGAQPGGLREAVVIGWVRMGLLHNVAMLTANQPPDHARGGVKEWVLATGVEREQEGALKFGIEVDGQPSGVVELDCDPSGVPVQRRQRVEFPEGVMDVVERYLRCSVVRG